MKASAFPNHNTVFAKNQPEYTPLPAYRHDDEQGSVTTIWELTKEEMQELFKTRRIMLTVLTFNQPLQPIKLSTDIPLDFREPLKR